MLVTVPAASVIVTVNFAPLSVEVVAGVVYDADVAPPMAVPFFFHWYVSVPAPDAVTLKVAVCPAVTVLLAGWDEMFGGTLTVSVAARLVTLPTLLETVTVNCAPLSEAVVAAVLYAAEVAPPMGVPFLLH